MTMKCDTLIVGGGSSGAVLASRLSESSNHSVILVEAGPDYGPYKSGAWPQEVVNKTGNWTAAASWGYWNEPRPGGGPYTLPTGKILGGSSAINAAGWGWPKARDLDEWKALGIKGWGYDDLLPYLQRVESDPDSPNSSHGHDGLVPIVRPKLPLSPYFSAFVEAAKAMGYGWVEDFNDPHGDAGLSMRIWNAPNDVRWNAAFAYLDPARSRPNLKIMASSQVARVVIENGRATSVEVTGDQGSTTISAGRIVVCAGAYNSPAVLMRSGVGPADHLRSLGIPVVCDVKAVGDHLLDHPVFTTRYFLSEETSRQAELLGNSGNLHWFQVVLRAASGMRDGYDYCLSPWGERLVEDGWECQVRIEIVKPRSTGALRLRSADPNEPPRIDTAFLSDPKGYDLAIFRQGLKTLRALMQTSPMDRVVVRERSPGPTLNDSQLDEFARSHAYSYHHPCGTCRMGPAGDTASVVDETCAVRGIRDLYVADASIMPTIPAVALNITCMAIGERVAELLKS